MFAEISLNFDEFCMLLIKIIIFEAIFMKVFLNFANVSKKKRTLYSVTQNFNEKSENLTDRGTEAPTKFGQTAHFRSLGIPGRSQKCQ